MRGGTRKGAEAEVKDLGGANVRRGSTCSDRVTLVYEYGLRECINPWSWDGVAER